MIFRVHWNVESFVFTLLVAIHLVPLWAFEYFPTQDGPDHVDNAAVLYNYFHSNHSVLREYYTLNLRFVPNWLNSIVLVGLVHFVPVITAEKILITAYVVLLPFSIRYALSAINEASTFLSMLAFPLIYNDFLHRGFYNFIFSIPLFFFIVGYWLRHRDSFRFREICCLAGLTLLLYFCHIVALGSLVVTLVILAASFTLPGLIRNYRSAPNGLRGTWFTLHNPLWASLCGLAPALFLAVVFVRQQGSPPSWGGSFWKLLVWPLYGVIATTNSPAHLLISMSVVGLFLGILYYAVSRRATQQNPFLGDGFLWAATILCILYFIAPESMSGGNIINPRFMVFTLLLLILWFGTQRFSRRVRFRITTAAIGLATLQIAINLPVYARVNESSLEYLSGTNAIEPNSTLLPLCFAREGCGVDRGAGYLRISPFVHLSGYITAQQHVVNLFNTSAHTDYFPIRYRDQLDPIPYLRNQIEGKRVWGVNVADYTRQTGGHIDYVLLWGIADAWHHGEDTDILLKWLAAEYDSIFTSSQQGALQIYRRKDFKVRE